MKFMHFESHCHTHFGEFMQRIPLLSFMFNEKSTQSIALNVGWSHDFLLRKACDYVNIIQLHSDWITARVFSK